MVRFRTGARGPSLASLLLLPILVLPTACALGAQSEGPSERTESGAFEAGSFRPGGQSGSLDMSLPPIFPTEGGPAARVEFQSGWIGGAALPDSGLTECHVNRWFGDRYFSATSSNFDQFDAGSANPGQDFWVEVWVPGEGPERIEPPSGSTASVSLTVVAVDGTHHSFHTWDSVNVRIVLDGENGVGFSATAASGSPESASSVTGFIACNSVEEIP